MYLLELTERTHFLHDLNTYIDSTARKIFRRGTVDAHAGSYGCAIIRSKGS